MTKMGTVKNITIEEKIRSCKNLAVKVKNLSEENIQKIIDEVENRKTFNFTIGLDENGSWECVNAEKKIPTFTSSDDTIQISFKQLNKETENDHLEVKLPQNSFPKISEQPLEQILTRNEAKRRKYGEMVVSESSSEVSQKKKVASEICDQDLMGKNKPKQRKHGNMAISDCNNATKKRILWEECKKKVNVDELTEGAIVFGKQAGYSPWPCRILSITKTKSSSNVKYFGYEDLRGTVKFNELVQLSSTSTVEIGNLIKFTLTNKCIKEFDRFQKAINEIKLVMESI